jgi:hypothetical protein
MSFNVIIGDIAKLAQENNFDVIIHGIHCFNYANSGAAQSITQAFPAAFEADKKTVKGDRSKLGTYSHAVCHPNNKPLVVVNAYTQYYYGRKHYQDPNGFDYMAFDSLCKRIKTRFAGRGLRFGFPLIGGDRGNADPHRIFRTLKQHMPEEDLTLVLFDEPGRRKKYKPSDFDDI